LGLNVCYDFEVEIWGDWLFVSVILVDKMDK